MVEEPANDVDELTVSELHARAAELEITGSSSMEEDELRQAVADAELQLADDGEGVAEEPLAEHEQSNLDAMGLDKRRGVVGEKYGAGFTKQATVYGVFLVVLAAVVIGGKLAADELDQGPEVNADKAPWSQADAEQRPPGDVDFPPSITP